MPTNVYLIGVYHQIQYINAEVPPEKSALVDKFAYHLKKVAQAHSVTLIAEEFSQEALFRNKAIRSTAQKVASELNIKHRFCDPTKQQRKQLGIADGKSRESIKLREQYWLDCIRANQDDTIIFICGDNHVKNFESLLSDEEFKVDIISTGWGSGLDNPFQKT